MLKIKPILIFKDGNVDQFERERTHKKPLKRLQEIIISQSPQKTNAHISIMHAGVIHEAEILAEYFKIKLGLEHIPIRNVPPANSMHSGPGIVGDAFFTAQALPIKCSFPKETNISGQY